MARPAARTVFGGGFLTATRLTLLSLCLTIVIGACRTGSPAEPAVEPWRASTEPGLAELGAEYGLMIGSSDDYWHFWDPIVLKTFPTEFNAIVTAGIGYDELRPERDRWNLAGLDSLVDFTEANDITFVYHSLLWFTGYPQWLARQDPSGSIEQITDLDRPELLQVMYDYIDTIVGRYRGRIDYYYVVNEPITSTWTPEEGFRTSIRPSFWHEVIGPEYIELALIRAHELDPEARLFLNDSFWWGSYPEMSMERNTLLLELVTDLLNRGIPLDGVGLQFYTDVGLPLHDWESKPDFELFRQQIKTYLDLGLEVHLSEVAVRIWQGVDEESLQQQAENFQKTLELALAEEDVTLFNVFGINDYYAEWWEGRAGDLEADAPLLFDDYTRPKPAYYALRHRLEGNTDLYQHDFTDRAINPGPDPPVDTAPGFEPPATLTYRVLEADYDSSGSWVLSDGRTTFGRLTAGSELSIIILALPSTDVASDPRSYTRVSVSGRDLSGAYPGDYAWHDNRGFIRGVASPIGLDWVEEIYPSGSRLSWDDRSLYQRLHGRAMYSDPDLQIVESVESWGFQAANPHYELEARYDKATGVLQYYRYHGDADSDMPLCLELELGELCTE